MYTSAFMAESCYFVGKEKYAIVLVTRVILWAHYVI